MDYYVIEGDDIKLICLVQQGPLQTKLSVYWEKDNKTLQPAEHPRMRVKHFRYLKIKRARKEDAGFYTCFAESECGGKNRVDMLLFVESKYLNVIQSLNCKASTGSVYSNLKRCILKHLYSIPSLMYQPSACHRVAARLLLMT